MPTPIPQTPPSLITGYRSTADQPTNRVKLDIKDEIVFWEPTATMFQTLTRGIQNRDVAKSYIKEWFEQRPYPIESSVNGAQTISDTALEVATGTGARFVAGQLVINRNTREIVLVTAVSTDTLTVRRAIGDNGVAAPMSDGDQLEIIATSYEEGVDVPTAKSVLEDRNYNYTEIFRDSCAWTGTDAAITLYGKKDPENETYKCGLRHKMAIERAMFFGRRQSFTGGSAAAKPQRTMGGLEYFIQSNVFEFSGAPLTPRNITEALEHSMKYGENGFVEGGKATKWFFGSRRWITELELMWTDKIQLRTLDTKMGLVVKEYQSTHGNIILQPMNIFNGIHAGYGFVVDMAHVAWCPLEGRDTKLELNRQAPGIDGTINEYMTEATLRVEVEGAHSLWKLPV